MSLQVQLKEILTDRESATLEAQLDVQSWIGKRKDVIQASPLQVKLVAEPQTGMVKVSGDSSFKVTFACSRCLTPFEETLTFPYAAYFQMVDEASTEGDPEDDDFHFIAGDQVDVTPHIEEAFVLGMPNVPICSDDCKGLCPNCGSNRNETTCSCSTERIDPRLAGLKDFFKQD